MDKYHEKFNAIIELLKEEEVKEQRFGFMSGRLGILLFLLHSKKSEFYDRAVESLDNIIENIIVERESHNYSFGIAGLGVLIEYAEQNSLIEMDSNEILEDLDDYLYEKMMIDAREGNYDFLNGAVGAGFYFLLRNKKTANVKTFIEDLVYQLELSSIDDGSSMKWNYYQAENGLLHPNVYNMGLSHGIPAILSFLSKVHNAGILIDKTKDMIEKIVNFIIENKTDSILYSFSEILDINTPNETVSRLAWCYGDLGVCCSLWQASDVLNSVELKEEIISILTIASGRKSKESTQIYDASLCHGTVGAAHIFQRFYDWTKIPLFKETADYWYEETLKMAHFEDGYAGYKVYTPIEYGGERPSRSFLEGISGIGLVLLYKISGKNPSWEELLFIS